MYRQPLEKIRDDIIEYINMKAGINSLNINAIGIYIGTDAGDVEYLLVDPFIKTHQIDSAMRDFAYKSMVLDNHRQLFNDPDKE